MEKAKFILSKKKLSEQVKLLKDLELKISYSYKTNKIIGKVLEENYPEIDFSIHELEEVNEINNKSKIWFFLQAENKEEIFKLLEKGLIKFVVDNELDLNCLLEILEEKKIKATISLRMKFEEHRIGFGKYFSYGMNSKLVNKLIKKIKDNAFVESFGIHVHRKSQNLSEWNVKSEIKDSLSEETLETIKFFNLGGGLPAKYRSFESGNFNYIFERISDAIKFLKEKGIEVYIEPGRFLAASPIKLVTNIIQIQGKNIIINTSLYKCALDTLLTGTKMLVENELKEGEDFLLKGNSPTRDDIFRYNVKLENPKIGDRVVFINAGAYNYTTDFFGYDKLKTEIVEDFNA
ncbi:MAG: decarboxylase [Candidatus Pacearchaeota archaeon]